MILYIINTERDTEYFLESRLIITRIFLTERLNYLLKVIKIESVISCQLLQFVTPNLKLENTEYSNCTIKYKHTYFKHLFISNSNLEKFK